LSVLRIRPYCETLKPEVDTISSNLVEEKNNDPIAVQENFPKNWKDFNETTYLSLVRQVNYDNMCH